MDYHPAEFVELSEVLKAMAHPVRLCIIKGLVEKGECNVTHMQNCLQMPQSTVSQHLQRLKAAGIITGIRRGLEINYKISDEKMIQFIKKLLEWET